MAAERPAAIEQRSAWMRALTIARRIELRNNITSVRLEAAARGRDEPNLLVVTADELEALLDHYEHGGFKTSEPKP